MPWYPGADRRYVTQFWDGARWLILLTEKFLRLENTWIALDDIAEVSYWSRTIVSIHGVVRAPVDRAFRVTDHHGTVTTLPLNWSSIHDSEVKKEAFSGLVEISRRVIEPRIADRILAALYRGEQFILRDGWVYLRLHRDGMSARAMRTHEAAWSDFYTVEANPYFNNMDPTTLTGQVRLWATRDGKPRMLTGLDTTVPNAVVLAGLLPACARSFGATG
ncbi:hypothetical protein H7J77_10350 [Mycolicibacillus parakoreensis]|uniref:Uncharacterized protein n=1 Tax=Mycolicibacillus parakoreensis TaxID=1069221 RepID=A0ABY3TYW9_9MYCO|nr:hypothetical protein [Mycolicibacillus parakoreensis]MCV7315941.1 hypothetical protein [Mycolicibacillus parakoreensis]ULN52427.1 hypothetical protein MIU77_16560 [Mycolicibacillus parakoreensis]